MARGSGAKEFLRELQLLRLQGQKPSHAVCVTTDTRFTTLFDDEMHLATVEVWRADVLDWTPVAGLRVYAVVQWPSFEERLRLFETIHAAEPAELQWFALDRRGEWLGRVHEIRGVPTWECTARISEKFHQERQRAGMARYGTV